MSEIGERHFLGRVHGQLFPVAVKGLWAAVYFPIDWGFGIDNQLYGIA